MIYTKEQFDTLAPYEDNFRTAIEARWARNPGLLALRSIHAVYQAATGDRRRLNAGCSVCLCHLLQAAGKAYFADKAERERAALVKKTDTSVKKNYTSKKKTAAAS